MGSNLYRSNTYRCHSSSKLLSIDDCSFTLDLVELEKLEGSLELKIFNKSRTEMEDSLLGYVNIDINNIFKKVKK